MTIRVKQYGGKHSVESDGEGYCGALDHLEVQKDVSLGWIMSKKGVSEANGNNYDQLLDDINRQVNTEYDKSFDVRSYIRHRG